MFVEGGWKPHREPDPAPKRVSDTEERLILWFVVVFAVLMLLAPIGGGTILQLLFAAS